MLHKARGMHWHFFFARLLASLLHRLLGNSEHYFCILNLTFVCMFFLVPMALPYSVFESIVVVSGTFYGVNSAIDSAKISP